MGKKLKNTLLIVCEGEKTEPNYLEHFANTHGAYWYRIDIFPEPPAEPVERLGKNDKRPKRNKPDNKQVQNEKGNRFELFLLDNYEEKEAKEIYNKHKKQPLTYVAEAFKRKEQSGYDSCWAIFDRDGGKTKDYEEAFDFAKQNNINIAFSARSFEVWLLAHFEDLDKIPLTLTKTACKGLKNGKNTGQEAGCNLNAPEYPAQDCKGSICLVGYLRKYLPDFEKHLYKDKDLSKYQKMMQTFEKKLSNACIRAEKLRKLIFSKSTTSSPLPIWQQPAHYTDVDRLLKEMLNLT